MKRIAVPAKYNKKTLAYYGQYTNCIKIEKLKNLDDICLNFDKKRMTAIMGINGSGKTTVLHALACCYKPQTENGENYKFSSYFTPSNYATWKDSSFVLDYKQSIAGKEELNSQTKYAKSSDRWSPRYDSRPTRNVVLIGIRSCVPAIETSATNSRVTFQVRENKKIYNATEREIHDYVLKCATYILDVEYTEKEDLITTSKSKKKYTGVKSSKHGKYTSLTMGAGEQRVFEILEAVIYAPKYSLILVDEIDLLLHVNALKKLIRRIGELADKNSLQVIFTTHSLVMSELNEWVAIQYLQRFGTKLYVVDSITPDCYLGMTGNQSRPINIYVEDNLSMMIINHICHKLNCKRFVEVRTFGSAVNAFSIIIGLKAATINIDNTIIVLDGDVYKTRDTKEAQIQRVLTGSESFREQERKEILEKIIQYDLPDGFSPEKFIRQMIIDLPEDLISSSSEIKHAMESIAFVDDNHDYIDNTIHQLGYDKISGYDRIIELASRSEKWDNFIKPISDWLRVNCEKFKVIKDNEVKNYTHFRSHLVAGSQPAEESAVFSPNVI